MRALSCLQAPQNVINISIPSIYDPALAPPGKHSVHCYTGAYVCMWGGEKGGGHLALGSGIAAVQYA